MLTGLIRRITRDIDPDDAAALAATYARAEATYVAAGTDRPRANLRDEVIADAADEYARSLA